MQFLKSKFLRKQLVIQSLVILFFIVSFDFIFTSIYFYHANKVEESKLESQALSISETVGKYSLNSPRISSLYNKDNLRLLLPNDNYDLWIIETSNLDIITNKNKIAYYQLSSENVQAIKKIFSGDNIFSKSFSSFTFDNSISVGVPIFDKEHQIRGALILHENKPPLLKAFFDVIPIIFAISIVLFALSIFLLYFLFKKNTHDISVINRFVERLVSGQYNIRTKIKSNDEFNSIFQNLNALAEYISQWNNYAREHEKMMSNAIFSSGYRLNLELSKFDNLLNSTNINENKLQSVYNNSNKIINYLLLSIYRHQPIYKFTAKMELINLIDPIKDAYKNRLGKLYNNLDDIGFVNNIDNKLVLYKADYNRICELTCNLIDICFGINKNDVLINCYEDRASFYVYIGTESSIISSNSFYSIEFNSIIDEKYNIKLIISNYLAQLHKIKLLYKFEDTISFIIQIQKT